MIEYVEIRLIHSCNLLNRTNWLMNSVLSIPERDVEPLEYLSHMNKTLLFDPDSGRASYSTNGFSLVGLALAVSLHFISCINVLLMRAALVLFQEILIKNFDRNFKQFFAG